jgi:hypothetical protein
MRSCIPMTRKGGYNVHGLNTARRRFAAQVPEQNFSRVPLSCTLTQGAGLTDASMSVGGLTQAQWQERLSVESTKALHGQGRRDMSAERRLILALTPRSQLSEQLSTLSKTISMPQLPALPPRERPAVRWISSHEPIYIRLRHCSRCRQNPSRLLTHMRPTSDLFRSLCGAPTSSRRRRRRARSTRSTANARASSRPPILSTLRARAACWRRCSSPARARARR